MSHTRTSQTSAFGGLDDIWIDSRTKGMPSGLSDTRLETIGQKGWNLRNGDLPTPLAVLSQDAIEQNSRWLNAVIRHYGVSLCPHGKTTMAPQLFRKQLEDGCWGITLSTQHQVHVARHYGIDRIFLANQILDPHFLSYIADTQEADARFDFYFLVDSEAGIEALENVARQRAGKHRPFQVLIEMGSPVGRTGCRTQEEALALAKRLAEKSEAAVLVGVEGFEGSIRGGTKGEVEERIIAFLGLMTDTAEAIAEEGLFKGPEILLTAGGSSYFDLVAKELSRPRFERPARVVLRSGCYIAHDAVMYEEQVRRAVERSPELAGLEPGLRQALTVWARVQSRPAPDRLFLNAGRRDLSYDADLPRPLRMMSGATGSVSNLSNLHRVDMLNDQHAYVQCPVDSPIRPGDLVELGISHPCTTFDKWDVICVMNENQDVIGAVKTFF